MRREQKAISLGVCVCVFVFVCFSGRISCPGLNYRNVSNLSNLFVEKFTLIFELFAIVVAVARTIIPDVVIINVASSHPVRYVNMLCHHYIGIMNVSMRFHQGFSAKSIGILVPFCSKLRLTPIHIVLQPLHFVRKY